MEEIHGVYMGRTQVGKVQLIRQGLYVRVLCRCQVSPEQVYRLFAVTDGRRENLGVVVPEGDGFLLDRKVPAKRLGTDGVQFLLSSGGGEKRGEYTILCPREPFFYIEDHKNRFLRRKQQPHPARPAGISGLSRHRMEQE